MQWPTPSTYRARPSVGTRQFTNPENPSFSMGYRRGFSISRKGTVPGILSFTLYTYTVHSQYELHHSYRCRKRASSQPIQPTQSGRHHHEESTCIHAPASTSGHGVVGRRSRCVKRHQSITSDTNEHLYSYVQSTVAENSPGPASYSPLTERIHVTRPAFTISGIRRQKTYELGPFAAH